MALRFFIWSGSAPKPFLVNPGRKAVAGFLLHSLRVFLAFALLVERTVGILPIEHWALLSMSEVASDERKIGIIAALHKI